MSEARKHTNYFEEATFYFEETDRTDNQTGDYSGQAITCAILALVQEQRKTNEYLARIADALDLQAAYGTLGDFTQHPRESWPGPCGTTETPND